MLLLELFRDIRDVRVYNPAIENAGVDLDLLLKLKEEKPNDAQEIVELFIKRALKSEVGRITFQEFLYDPNYSFFSRSNSSGLVVFSNGEFHSKCSETRLGSKRWTEIGAETGSIPLYFPRNDVSVGGSRKRIERIF